MIIAFGKWQQQCIHSHISLPPPLLKKMTRVHHFNEKHASLK